MGMREKLIELICDSMQDGCVGWCNHPPCYRVERVANNLIANGVTIPVRCKECKHWVDGVAGCTDHVKCCKIGYYFVGENGYCVYAERKTDDGASG